MRGWLRLSEPEGPLPKEVPCQPIEGPHRCQLVMIIVSLTSITLCRSIRLLVCGTGRRERITMSTPLLAQWPEKSADTLIRLTKVAR